MKLILKFTFLSMILLLVACQKENTSKTGSLTEANRAKLERLNYFNQVLRKHHENDQVHARNSVTFTPGETRWALESVMNINHAMRPDQFENLIIARHKLEVPLTNNAVSEADFYDAYMSLYGSLVVAFDAALLPNKYFIGMIIDNDTLMTDKIRFKVKTQIASESQAVPSCGNMFDRDYYIGTNQECSDSHLSGSCDETVEGTNGLCLMTTYLNELIQHDLNALNPDPQNFPWFGGFIGDEISFVDVLLFLGYENLNFDSQVDHPLKHYLMIYFFKNDLQGQSDYCFPEDILDWFLCNHYVIANDYSLPSGYHLAMVDLYLHTVTSGSNYTFGNDMTIYKGVPFFTNQSPGGGFVIGPALPHADLMQSVVMP